MHILSNLVNRVPRCQHQQRSGRDGPFNVSVVFGLYLSFYILASPAWPRVETSIGPGIFFVDYFANVASFFHPMENCRISSQFVSYLIQSLVFVLGVKDLPLK